MILAPSSFRQASPGRLFPQLRASVVAVSSLVLSIVAGVLIVVLGLWALVVPFYVAMVALSVIHPDRAALALLFLAVVFEPGAFDQTEPISRALYTLAPALEDLVPLTVSPLEILIAITAVSFWFHPHSGARGSRLPLLVWGVPGAMALGLVFGLSRGGDGTIAYHEMRGLIFAIAAFYIATRMPHGSAKAARVVVLASLSLSLVILARYEFYTKSGQSLIPSEFAYAHENAMFLGLGFVVGACLLLRQQTGGMRLFLLAHNILVFAAMLATGRRAGTLVLIVGILVLAIYLIPRKPAIALFMSIPVILLSGAYLGTYWNKEYGAVAQPARAIRSQVDPSARDESSDLYRLTERYDAEQTIRLNQLFGVGFGRPFAQFQPLPDLSSFWPLQSFTPHQNLLWLWLKMGILGLATFLSVWVLAFRACLEDLRGFARRREFPVVEVTLAAGLLMYLTYARVDLALIGTRSCAPLGVIMALALLGRGRGRNSRSIAGE